MTIRILFAAVGIVLLLGTPLWAQPSTTPTASARTFDSLSPGNQKIANALFSAQNTAGPNTAGTTLTPLTKDQIAGLKGTEGWGRVFKQMKADGLVQAKNLGQVVSAHQHELNAARKGTITTNASANTTTANASANTRTTRSGRTTMASSARRYGQFAAAGSTSGRSFAGSSHRMSGVAVSTMGRGGFGHGGMSGGFGHAGIGGGFGGGHGGGGGHGR